MVFKSSSVKVQRKFIKFAIIYQTPTASSEIVKIITQIWNKFKRKKEVIKINFIALTAPGSPLSFGLFWRPKVLMGNIDFFLFFSFLKNIFAVVFLFLFGLFVCLFVLMDTSSTKKPKLSSEISE